MPPASLSLKPIGKSADNKRGPVILPAQDDPTVQVVNNATQKRICGTLYSGRSGSGELPVLSGPPRLSWRRKNDPASFVEVEKAS